MSQAPADRHRPGHLGSVHALTPRMEARQEQAFSERNVSAALLVSAMLGQLRPSAGVPPTLSGKSLETVVLLEDIGWPCGVVRKASVSQEGRLCLGPNQRASHIIFVSAEPRV